MMPPEFIFAFMRNLVVLTSVLLTIKNLFWCGRVLALHLSGNDFRQISHKKHETEEWVIRAGSVLIAGGAFFALILAAVSRVVPWVAPTTFVNPFAFVAMVCFETLMVWSLLFFTKRSALMYASIACLVGLSVLVEFSQ